MTTKIVISGYYGFGNFGDEAILAVLLNKLKQVDAEVVVLSSNPRRTSFDHLVNAVNSFDFYQVTGIIKKSDVLISGGGSLLQDVTSLKSLIYYLWVICVALWYKKTVIIFAQGIGPIRNRIAQFITAKVLKKCEYVSVRDDKSQKMLEWYGIKSDLLCDPIFSLDLSTNRQIGVVGVQLRDFVTMNNDLLINLARFIVKNFSDKKIEIFSFQDEIDLHICEKFQSILKEINPAITTELVKGLSIVEIINRISMLEYMIAMRFHAIVVALKTGVPVVAINYDTKVEKLAKDAEIPLISMNATENLDKVFDDLKNLDMQKLGAFVSKKHFDWSAIDNILK